SLLEGQTLHATVNAIKDLAGNPMESSVQWQFDVRRSDFTWASSSVYREQTYLGSGSVLATLVNGSTGDLQFDLTGVPSWLTPTQSTGTVVAGQTLGIGFAIDPTLPVGSYQGTITAEVPNTAIAAQLDVRVDIVCQPPSWTVDPSDFSQSMTAVLELSIGGTVSTDPDDIVFGFVGDEIRGVAQPILVDTISPPRYLAFMNIYSDALAGENVRFKIYDSDQCKLYQAADNYLYFEADRRKGTPEVPITLVALDAPSVSQQEIDLNAGWTWFSLNLADSLDMSVVTVLGDLNPEAGDLIKSRTAFAQYDAELGWQGSLTDLDVRESYAISLSTAGTILHEGQPVAADTPIYLVDGWNWVGYPPSASQAINDALVNLMPSDGDVMKSQSAFAEHVASVPVWVGGLDTLVPGGGYKLYLEDAVGAGAWLQYADPQPFAGAGAFATVAGEAFGRPSGSTTNGTGGTAGAIVVPTSQGLGGDRTGAIGSASANRPNWHLDVGRQFNMTVIARVQVDGSAEGKTPGVLGAFVGDELRGYVESQYIAPLDEYYAFLVIDSDVADGETVTFRYFDEANDAVGDVVETVSFRADDALGTLHEPLVLHAERGLGQSGVPAVFQLAAPYPNPIRTDVGSTVRWDMPRSAHVAVQVFDVSGKLVETVADEAMPAGSHSRPLSTRELSSGIYFLRMQTPGYVKTHKIMVVR
ncbi:MAG: T9SS type A sorting domain-containing protein, partial [Candidatus Eisenbacteria bacterium]|nr:T9SS type A sorting domain-containing protein [Candidatus Eisenbacteria bacterium]